MRVFELVIPSEQGLTNFELAQYIRELRVPHFRGVFMRDELPPQVKPLECGVVNLNTSEQVGSHWVCFYKGGVNQRIYFDSFGQVTLDEVQKYLKTVKEYKMGKAVIQRNTDVVQRINTHVCGHLCLFVLTSLAREHLTFDQVLNKLNDGYTRGDW